MDIKVTAETATWKPQETGARVVGPTPGYPHGATIFTKPLRVGTRLASNVTPDAPVVVTGKKVKHVFIEATFPELRGGQMYQSAHGEASGTKPAIARAFRELLKKIPGKRVSIIKATISITTKQLEDSNVKV